ncbi:hypothetical protein, partial [Methylosinus sp. KRF6]|uniref:hypothetical protein n=1 Tax=Methylosinus sp. KRF6 TaxID=2846853 RepID=UPI001C0DFFD8
MNNLGEIATDVKRWWRLLHKTANLRLGRRRSEIGFGIITGVASRFRPKFASVAASGYICININSE